MQGHCKGAAFIDRASVTASIASTGRVSGPPRCGCQANWVRALFVGTEPLIRHSQKRGKTKPTTHSPSRSFDDDKRQADGRTRQEENPTKLLYVSLCCGR